jgi:hypothetical protein
MCAHILHVFSSDRARQTEVAEKWAKAQGHMFFETSAKSSSNVEEAFVWLVKEITKRRNLKVPFPGGC